MIADADASWLRALGRARARCSQDGAGNHAGARRLLEVNRAERARLSAVLNSITEEVYFADPQRRYTYANPAALREFGQDTVEGVDIQKIVSQLEVLRTDGNAATILRSSSLCARSPARSCAT